MLNVNTIKVNIDKNVLKNYYNSPLSHRYNKYFIDNRNKIANSKKTYEKRDTIQRSPRPNYNKIQIDKINKSKEKTNNNDNNDADNNNANKKLVFNDEQEIIEYIKNKYSKRNVDKIINRGGNNNNIRGEPKKENKPMGLMTTEEGKKIKQKNEELSSEIKSLQYENRQYKKELDYMKNRFNDLSKEINTIKENK